MFGDSQCRGQLIKDKAREVMRGCRPTRAVDLSTRAVTLRLMLEIADD